MFFLYKGTVVKEDLKIEDINNEDNTIKILVYKIEDTDGVRKIKRFKIYNISKMQRNLSH